MSTAVQRALQRLREGLQGADAYEAQQVLKAAYYRMRTRGQLEDSYELLQQAAVLQFAAGQFTCGLELAKLLLEAYKADGVPAVGPTLQRLHTVLASLPRVPPGDGTSQTAMIDGAAAWADAVIAWAGRQSATAADVQQLHTVVADWLYGERGWRSLGPVSAHYAHSLNVAGLHSVLADGLDPSKAREWDLYVMRAALLLLGTAPPLPRPRAASIEASQQSASAQEAQQQHLTAARQLLDRCEPDASQPEFAGMTGLPLINCCRLYVEALERKLPSLAATLRQHYQAALQRDPDLTVLMDKVEALYLGVQRNGGSMGGMLGNLMQMLTAGGDM